MDSQATYRDSAQAANIVTGRRGILCACSMKVICLFAFLLALAVGLALGAIFAFLIFAALPAVITFAVVMAVLIIAALIMRMCAGCCCDN